jgi:hypothetical protein
MDLIQLDGVSRRFGSTTALADITLSVHQGEFLALLGPSGCGKTTLLRMIAGFLDPSSGNLTIDGKRMNSVPADRRPVNTVFQNYALFPHMTVADNIAFGLKRARLPKAEITQRVKETLELVGMLQRSDLAGVFQIAVGRCRCFPQFGQDVWLAGFGHRRNGCHGRRRHNRDGAAISLFHQEFGNTGDDRCRGPVHFSDRHVAAGGGGCADSQAKAR